MITNYLISKSLLENEIYKKVMSNGGEAVVSEIDSEGSICIYFCAPFINGKELEIFRNGIPKVYSYEKNGKFALIFSDIFQVECTINPSYYDDNRYELFKNKEELEIYCYLCDTAMAKILDAKILCLTGDKLKKVKEGLALNCAFSRNEFNSWIANVLYARKYKENLKLSTYLGKCDTPSDKKMLLI